MAFKDELELYVRSRFTVINLITNEEERAMAVLEEIVRGKGRCLYTWDFADGLVARVATGTKAEAPKADPLTVLEHIEKSQEEGLFVLKDFHHAWDRQPKIIRKLRNLAQALKYTRKTIIITSPSAAVPPELKDDIFVFEFPSPDYAEMERILDKLTKDSNAEVALSAAAREKLIKSALGLSSNQAQRVFAKAIVTHGKLDERAIEIVLAEKKQIIRESGALEFYAATETIADVGGLEVLKGWLRVREKAFTQEAADYGLPTPKGIALIGIPGTGKSLTAKMVSGLWRLPLLRLDMGAVFGSLVGQSEENIRKALRLAETVSPCLLWIDEMEKAFAGGAGGAIGDSGTSVRVFGTIITWMQEKTKPVFIVATANNIAGLPPETLRKGRFDEVFFLDLPTTDERREIFKVHLAKRRPVTRDFDLDALAAASEGFVGAEIEQAVIDAMHAAFDDGGREFTTQDILGALKNIVPLARSQREDIEYLRNWLREGRARSASFAERETAERQQIPLG
jgi:SpoVK/Ycf46/Vps4 family AAA+-type ATPase